MSRPRLTRLAISLALCGLSPLAAAQTAAPMTGAAPSALPPQTQSALKLAGLVTFVANACPELKTDYHRFEAAIKALGLSEADLNKFDLKGRYLGYTARYNADPKASCQRAKAEFGPQGSTLPNLFQVAAATAPAPAHQ